jgi:hypothetical protein
MLRLKAEACRVLADVSDNLTRKAHWLEQADHWQALPTEVEPAVEKARADDSTERHVACRGERQPSPAPLMRASD